MAVGGELLAGQFPANWPSGGEGKVREEQEGVEGNL
jgi:hypothetical protein